MASSVFLEEMGQRIAVRRKELRITQESLAEQVGVSLQTISCIELGKKAVRPENLAKICSALSISADYILFGIRSNAQMSDLANKLSRLTAEQYDSICVIVQLLQKGT